MKKLFFLLCCVVIPLGSILPQIVFYDYVPKAGQKIDRTKISPPSIYRDRIALRKTTDLDKPIVIIYDDNVPQNMYNAINKAKEI